MCSFQKIIARLLNFWEQKNCIIHQGYDLEIGAGTFNPATFFRCLGPEPYRTAYVESCRRPQDGRYGSHPNRLQNYYQMQVIIKPSPKDIKDLFLLSLVCLGLDLKKHDIRFVHDDWENPTIGAWGLGWEVWLNGMEITQITYFQGVGGIPLKTISSEITYGLERIALYLQNKDSIFDILWNENLTYGDIYKINENEWSIYNFEEANNDMWSQHFEDFSNEALKLIKKQLPIPAYDFVMKSSHAFNILDSRGVLSVTERIRYISRIRYLAKEVALSYINLRKTLDYPLLKKLSSNNCKKVLESEKNFSKPFFNDKEDFLLEIGTEEIPAAFLPIGIINLEKELSTLLNNFNLSYESLKVYGTPKRLSCIIQNLDTKAKIQTKSKKGPLLKKIFNSDDTVSSEGRHFFSSLKKPIHSLQEMLETPFFEVKTFKNESYIFISSSNLEIDTFTILKDELAETILKIQFPKTMIWDEFQTAFARPIRSLVCILKDQIVPIKLGSISSGRESFGHTQIKPEKFIINTPSEYLSLLKKYFVLVDQNERKLVIENELKNIENEHQIDVEQKDKVVSETMFLTEWPIVVIGSFKQDYCSLPKELLIAEMLEHQKYFPFSFKGSLINKFGIVIDNFKNDYIIEGNERALSPRLSDGKFLFLKDLETPTNLFLEKLKEIIFHEQLGSMYEKIERYKDHLNILHPLFPFIEDDIAKNAIAFCKIDLASSVVFEFPELQGIIASYYLKNLGYSIKVTEAIREHSYHIKNGLSLSPEGVLLTIIDRLDNLLSCFILNLKPTSSADPYALRRQVLEILTIFLDKKLDLNFHDIISKCLSNFSLSFDRETIKKDLIDFINSRFVFLLKNKGFLKHEVLAMMSSFPLASYYKIFNQLVLFQEIKEFHQSELLIFSSLFHRIEKILPKKEEPSKKIVFKEKDFILPIEKILFLNLGKLEIDLPKLLENDYKLAFLEIYQVAHLISSFFDQVKIIDDNLETRNKRLFLLEKASNLFLKIIDPRLL